METIESPAVPLVVEPSLGIWFDGRAYHYQQYRYDRIEDAIAYARLDRGRPGFHEEPLPTRCETWQGPTGAERDRMRSFGIVYEHYAYRYGAFRYEALNDALDYASRTAGPAGAQ